VTNASPNLLNCEERFENAGHIINFTHFLNLISNNYNQFCTIPQGPGASTAKAHSSQEGTLSTFCFFFGLQYDVWCGQMCTLLAKLEGGKCFQKN